MMTDLQLAVLGKVLSPASRDRLAGWMQRCETGKARLRAGLPTSWRVGDKTGTGDNGTAGDIAVAWTPAGPIVVAAYLTGATRAVPAERDGAFAEVGKIVAETLRPHG
jgi:beta-lactamase class A